LCSRNLAHGLDFNSLRRYNGGKPAPGRTIGKRRASNFGSVCGRNVRLSGDQVDQQLKQLMKELGEAINESLSDSEQIAEVVSRIKEGGYDIFLVLEATIGVSKQGEKSADKTALVTTLSTNPEFKINDQDLKFLKSLRIKVEEK
jgi:pentose-5-phosphate-3-epimerase